MFQSQNQLSNPNQSKANMRYDIVPDRSTVSGSHEEHEMVLRGSIPDCEWKETNENRHISNANTNISSIDFAQKNTHMHTRQSSNQFTAEYSFSNASKQGYSR